MERLADAAHSNTDAIRGAQDEIAEYRRQLQSRTIELETLRGTKDSLERQCMETEDRHHGDIHSLQVRTLFCQSGCLSGSSLSLHFGTHFSPKCVCVGDYSSAGR